jgi:PIN domain nuclease of toxin-antitoxin system
VSRLLADTHAVLWWLADDAQLSEPARAVFSEPANEIHVSAAGIWEAAIKRSLGKLEAPDDLLGVLESEGLELLPVTAAHAWEVRDLPPHHGDPFDRLMIAQALIEGMPIVTRDRRFAQYGVAVRW